MGLASATQLAQAHADARVAAERVQQLNERLEKLRGDADAWKRRHAAAAGAVTEWKEAAARAESRAEEAVAQAAEWKRRADAVSAQRRELKDRLTEVRRTATLAREQLMATEVKLDLIEAAIQVLDARTREAGVRRQ